jgi:hypothetical protein
MAPTMIDDPLSVGLNHEYGSIEPFDVCDIVSGEEPIECMKLIYRKLPEFEASALDLTCFEGVPVEVIRQVGLCSNNRNGLARCLVEMEREIEIGVVDGIEEWKKFLFYVELMCKVFNKLNEKSQRGIKEIKIIFGVFQKICFRLSNGILDKLLSS